MKEKPLPLNSTVELQPWEHFIQEFDGLLRIQCFIRTEKNEELIMAQFMSNLEKTTQEGSNSNKVRLFN